ncbi:hypothetical protein FJTKL_05011 [Diaporthe vaccinii]|uniref:Uncharacterized protein n=1 Tax=Diaporthe vaccinii TaxID=105482 RepID=A0ABR4EYU4_9PEZI
MSRHRDCPASMPSKLFNHSHALKMLAKSHNKKSTIRRVASSFTPFSTPGARGLASSPTLCLVGRRDRG